jgi:hypothetical protein
MYVYIYIYIYIYIYQAEAQRAAEKQGDGEQWPEGTPGAHPSTLRSYSTFLLEKKKDPTGADKVWTDVVGEEEEEGDGGGLGREAKLKDLNPQEKAPTVKSLCVYCLQSQSQYVGHHTCRRYRPNRFFGRYLIGQNIDRLGHGYIRRMETIRHSVCVENSPLVAWMHPCMDGVPGRRWMLYLLPTCDRSVTSRFEM